MFLSLLVPDLHVESVYEIDLHELKARGIKGIITDLDNTLIEWNRPDATPKLVQWMREVEELGFSVVIVSNNKQTRVSKVAEPLGVPYIHQARKPTLAAFREATRRMNLSVAETVVIGDQLFTDVLGGRRMGFYTILVVPVAASDGIFTRINRMLERVALGWLRRRGMIPWEDKHE
ncbi:YqeG family HAD IIIA-type phosphatase [Aneurinibacillus sp. Ricciae_BoGa-3]|uniref:YqeG family HAD IIIA-type phosphatase n=1 Tax=Aneurinibacillus sp. Ricciae_BoGa-3 TaxID=3022697 RepID=UPI00233FA9F6|nr:YqeG family HAD IIIA-type phosphatase [Aneurinibacillus sp. Ricciae_BoGa-3]WCK53522.1 YqeG family HAD IIIA-type phosphatase [Aneurinibacillus sp. Ricciae_BoGa-3]